MIPINDYRQFVAELTNYALQQAGIEEKATVRLAVTETQLVNLLKDQAGIVIAGNIPGADMRNTSGWMQSEGDCILYVLEKMPADYQGTEREFDHYATLQRLMTAIVGLLVNADGFNRFCDKGDIDYSRPLTIEWEYNTYGGFNGLSVSYRLRDKAV